MMRNSFNRLKTAKLLNCSPLTKFQNFGTQSAMSTATSRYERYVLAKKEQYNHNVVRYFFKVLGGGKIELTVACCFLFKIKMGGNTIIRPYTPVNVDLSKGVSEYLIKTYEKGNLSKHLSQMKVDDEIEIMGPLKKIQYPFSKNLKTLGMIAGGTGITPMLQVIKKLIISGSPPNITLLFANQTPGDIILREELERLERENPNFKLKLVVSRNEPKDPKFVGTVGYIDKEFIAQHLHSLVEDEDGAMVFVCGPPGMIQALCGPKGPNKTQGKLTGTLAELGFKSHQVFKF